MKNYLLKTILGLITVTTIVSCSSEASSCTPIDCQNGGDSTSDCGCNCVSGFGGIDCSAKFTPTAVKITKVEILSFPEFDYAHSTDWDPTESGLNKRPDIYYTIYQNSAYIDTSFPNWIENADVNQDYTFTLSTPFSITAINAPIIIELRDYNIVGNTYDIMGATLPDFIYDPSDITFPQTMILENIPANIQVKLYLSYEF